MKNLLILFFCLSCSLIMMAQTPAMDGYYQLKTQFRGEGECLEGNQASSNVHNGKAFMDKCQNVSGQYWKFEDAGRGYFRLTTLFRGHGECLEGSSNEAGAAFMDRRQNVSGQLWKVEDAGNGWYRLKTQFRGENECLEGNQASSKVHGGAAFMDKQQNVSGQLWKFEKVKHILATGETLKAGERLTSENGAFILRMQEEDGNLCVYKYENGAQGAFVWGSMKYGFKNGKLVMQDDGNLCVYDGSNSFKWGSYQDKGYALGAHYNLILTNEGKLNVLDGSNKVIWSN